VAIDYESSVGEWNFLSEEKGKLLEPIEYWYPEESNVSSDPKIEYPMEDRPFVIDCMEPKFSLLDPWQLIMELHEKNIDESRYYRLFTRNVILKLDNLKVSKVPIRTFLKRLKPYQKEFIKYLECFGEEGVFEIIRTKNRLKELSTLLETKGLKVTYCFESLDGDNIKGNETVSFAKPLTYYKWKTKPIERKRIATKYDRRIQQEFISSAETLSAESLVPFREMSDATANLLTGQGSSTQEGVSLINESLRVVLGKEEITESWSEIDKVLGPSGYFIVTISLLSPMTGVYQVEVFVNDEILETFIVDAWAPDSLKFRYDKIEAWLSRFRGN